MVFGENGKGWRDVDPNKFVFTFGGSYVCANANLGENRSKNATVRVRTDGYTHTLTEANRFLAKVNSRSGSLYVVVGPSVVCLSVSRL